MNNYSSSNAGVLTAGTSCTNYFKMRSAVQDVNSYLPCGGTLLMEAVQIGSREDVEFLLSRGANVNIGHQQNGYTALCYAAINGALDIMKLLFAWGAYTHIIVGRDYVTPLILAVKYGHQSVAKWLVKDGVISNYWDGFGLRALDYARLKGDQCLIEFLVVQEVAVANFFSLFDRAVLDYKAIAAITATLGYNERNMNGETLCHMAAKHNHIRLMQILATYCVDDLDWHSHNHKGYTALDIAIRMGHVDIVCIMQSLEHSRLMCQSSSPLNTVEASMAPVLCTDRSDVTLSTSCHIFQPRRGLCEDLHKGQLNAYSISKKPRLNP